MNAVIIGIDASRAFSALSTGTERYSREVITALLRLAPQHEFRLYTRDLNPTPASLHLGEGAGGQVKVIPLGPRRLWTHLGLAHEITQRPPDALFIPAHVFAVITGDSPHHTHRRHHS